MKRNIVFIGGINGSGKTTILNILKTRTNIPCFEGSHNMMKMLGIETNYDLLRNFSHEQKNNAQVESFKNISESSDRAIATSHFVKVWNGVVTESVGDWYDYCKVFVHVNVNPADILKRIHSENRERNLFAADDISDAEKIRFLTQAQERSLDVARRVSKEYGTPLVIIENGSLDQAVEQILNIL